MFVSVRLTSKSTFRVFRRIRVAYPVVFAATCSRCTLQTFGIGDVSCLLGPVKERSVRRTLRGLALFDSNGSGPANPRAGRLIGLVHVLGGRRDCGARFLVPVGNSGLLPISISVVLLFCVESYRIGTILASKARCSFPRALSRLARYLSPALFFQTGHRCLLSQRTVGSVSL